MTSCTGARRCARTRAGFRTPVCTGAPAGADCQTGLCSPPAGFGDSAPRHVESHFTLWMFVLACAQNHPSLGRSGSGLVRDLPAFADIAERYARQAFESKRRTVPWRGFAREGGGRERRPGRCCRAGSRWEPGRLHDEVHLSGPVAHRRIVESLPERLPSAFSGPRSTGV